ncbi:hypothetical protein RRG08_065252 [Elysia crispata]|uniref:Uncharacterized protein n=1 Tax=Elysia crispata TaxID=231223 RepID=A0AAE0YHI4_9GAST|nr:hypothetical protein RRG08_065252 [Elysia crispata]
MVLGRVYKDFHREYFRSIGTLFSSPSNCCSREVIKSCARTDANFVCILRRIIQNPFPDPQSLPTSWSSLVFHCFHNDAHSSKYPAGLPSLFAGVPRAGHSSPKTK